MKSAHEFSREEIKAMLDENGYSECDENVDKVFEAIYADFGYAVSMLQTELPEEIEDDEEVNLEEVYEDELNGMFGELFEELKLVKEETE